MGKEAIQAWTLREELLNGEIFYKIVHASIGSTRAVRARIRHVAGCAMPTGSVGHAGATA
jgi:hypothetical protein